MKNLRLAVLLACSLVSFVATGWSDDHGKGKGAERKDVSAEEMSAVGLLAASAIGASVFALRRRVRR